MLDGKLVVDYAYINNNVSDMAIKYSEDDGDAVNIEGHEIENSPNVYLQDLSTNTDISTTFTGGYNMNSEDDFFESTDFIGAGSAWLNGWSL
ncbi:MAG: hypothetical protein B7C24_14925 [Bacteroidetes bacterium 4572_77]|nr:MAG: hypothetical protein B7C24_14925 [Bacteroidetes bacterium 4572_77]